MNELKPCPFCGDVPTFSEPIERDERRCWVVRPSCDCHNMEIHAGCGREADLQMAAENWNIRPNPRPPDDGAVEALRDQLTTVIGAFAVTLMVVSELHGEQDPDVRYEFAEKHPVIIEARAALAKLKAKGGGA